jgi:hypothetical protein
MSVYLCSTVENYRADYEHEADELINLARESRLYDLKKSNVQKKEIKVKGEVVDEFFLVSLTKNIQDPKNPETNVKLNYEV